MPTTLNKRTYLISMVLLAGWTGTLAAQEFPQPLPELIDPDPDMVPDVQTPLVEGPVLEDSTGWNYQRTTTNRSGDVINSHERSVSDDGNTYLRQHSVTNPRGEMVQSWERSSGEDGYAWSRQQTFTAPDGTLLRQHEMTRSGSDPYNYSREKSMVFRDGRTLEMTQTRSWDGENGTMERTFLGPNGQDRSFQRAWSPEDAVAGGQPAMPQEPARVWDSHEQPKARIQAPWAPLNTATKPKPEGGFWSKLNPFHRGGTSITSWKPSSRGRSGFTLGAGSGSRPSVPRSGLTNKQPGENASKAHRPQVVHPSHPLAGAPEGTLPSSAASSAHTMKTR